MQFNGTKSYYISQESSIIHALLLFHTKQKYQIFKYQYIIFRSDFFTHRYENGYINLSIF